MTARYLLDSNALIAALKGAPASLQNRLVTLAPTRIFLSAIVLAELQTGAEKSRNPAANHAALDELTTFMEPVAFDQSSARIYGKLRAELERKGRLIGPMDLLIAAQALQHDLVLVTANLREFQRVPGLRCENWMR